MAKHDLHFTRNIGILALAKAAAAQDSYAAAVLLSAYEKDKVDCYGGSLGERAARFRG